MSKKGELIKCGGCGKDFYVKPYRVKTAKTCSTKCKKPYSAKTWRDRLMRKINIDENGCWNWQGHLTPSGYGMYHYQVNEKQKTMRVHRASYIDFMGEIKKGLVLDHLCRNRKCANPKHLEPVTPRENNDRSNSASSLNAKKTHCKRGHPFNEENTRVWNSHRSCITCNKAWHKRKKEEKCLNTVENQKQN